MSDFIIFQDGKQHTWTVVSVEDISVVITRHFSPCESGWYHQRFSGELECPPCSAVLRNTQSTTAVAITTTVGINRDIVGNLSFYHHLAAPFSSQQRLKGGLKTSKIQSLKISKNKISKIQLKINPHTRTWKSLQQKRSAANSENAQVLELSDEDFKTTF